MLGRTLLTILVLIQAALGIRLLARLARTARGTTIQPATTGPVDSQPVSIVVPVLNERDRLGPCLDGLIQQGDEVAEILVVDGGSTDGTREFVMQYSRCDARLRLLGAGPPPSGWNGKAWGLQAGIDAAAPDNPWILTIDADVRPEPLLTRSLLHHAKMAGLEVLSVATRQDARGHGEALIHPSMLTTLVYRFGIPGGRYRKVGDVQANGQCFLARRDVLDAVGGFSAVRESICEDITIARRMVDMGYDVGFYEAGDLVSVRMYPDWRTTWREWPRSLPMRDRYFGVRGAVGLLEVVLLQALPLPLLAGLLAYGRDRVPGWMISVNITLLATRVGVLFGTMRAYVRVPWTYWLSPILDMPVALTLVRSAMRRQFVWRGRALNRGA